MLFRSSSSYGACLVYFTSPVWSASRVAHPKDSRCEYPFQQLDIFISSHVLIEERDQLTLCLFIFQLEILNFDSHKPDMSNQFELCPVRC